MTHSFGDIMLIFPVDRCLLMGILLVSLTCSFTSDRVEFCLKEI